MEDSTWGIVRKNDATSYIMGEISIPETMDDLDAAAKIAAEQNIKSG